MAPTSPTLTPRSRAKKRNRDRQRRFRARKKLKKQEEANARLMALPEQFPWSSAPSSDGDSSAAGTATSERAVEEPRPPPNRQRQEGRDLPHGFGAARQLFFPMRQEQPVVQRNVGPTVPPVPAVDVDMDEMPAILEEVRENPADEVAKDGTWLARALTKIQCFGDISNASMEKVTKLFMDNLDDISAMKQRGEVSSSYRHNIRKRLNVWQPTYHCAIKVEDLDNPEADPQYIDNLKSIPKKYLNPTLRNHYRLLRSEAYTSLKDIKKHYAETHKGMTTEELRIAYKRASVGIDGVREGNSGSRTLYIVSIMFAGCVFLWRVYHPYKGCVGAKPTLAEMLK